METLEKPRECDLCGEPLNGDIAEIVNAVGMTAFAHVQCYLDRREEGWTLA